MNLIEKYLGEIVIAGSAIYLAHNGKELTAWYSKEQRKKWMYKNKGKILNRTAAERKYGAMAVIQAKMSSDINAEY